LKNKRPTWCHLLFYFTSYVLNMLRTLIYPSSGACDYFVELPHWSYCSWFDACWSFGVVGLEWYPCCRLKLLFTAHKKWNKIARDIKLVFYSSTITMMHGPINIRFTEYLFERKKCSEQMFKENETQSHTKHTFMHFLRFSRHLKSRNDENLQNWYSIFTLYSVFIFKKSFLFYI